MRRTFVIVLVCIAGCGSDGNPPDSGVTPDRGRMIDGQVTDGQGTDGQIMIPDAAVDLAGPECTGSGNQIHKAVGGSPGKTVMFHVNIGLQPNDSDGILGTVTENGNDLQLEDVAVYSPAVAFGASGSAIYQIAYPAVGSFTATRLGAAPGIDALAAFSNTHLFGAAGLSLSRIIPSPFAVTPIATIKPPNGCTKIVDFIAAVSGGPFVFIVALDCGASTRITGFSWVEGSNTLGDAGPNITAPAGAVGLSLGTLVTADHKLYRYSTVGNGTITFVRNLSPCLGTPVRGMQE